MTTVLDIFEALKCLAPLELQESFDNAGFLVGHGDREVTHVLLALDITDEVIDEAVSLGAELIVSHHPVIFEALKSVTADGPGRKVLTLIEHGIAAICMHTNLDIAQGGVNDVLIRLLGAEPSGALDRDGCGRVGELARPLSTPELLARCKERLNAKGIRYVDSGRPIRKLAVMGGAGGGALEDAIAKGCDAYVTADVKYHSFLDASEAGITLIDADHFCTEDPVIPYLAQYLEVHFPALQFSVSDRHHQIVDFF